MNRVPYVPQSGSTIDMQTTTNQLQTVDSFFNSKRLQTSLTYQVSDMGGFFKRYLASIISLPNYVQKVFFDHSPHVVEMDSMNSRMEVARMRQEHLKDLARTQIGYDEIDPRDEGMFIKKEQVIRPKPYDPYSSVLIFGSSLCTFGLLQEIFS